MTLEARITALATTIAAQINTAKSERGTMGSLATANQSSLVAALNELHAEIDAFSAATINDASSSSLTQTWSITKISNEISSAVSALVDGAPGALDTLNELAAALQDDAGAVSAIIAAQAKRVAVDQVQSFSAGEKTQAQQNIDAQNATDIGDTDHDFALDFTTALT